MSKAIKVRRRLVVGVALALVFAITAPLLAVMKAGAYNLATDRYIKLSNSAASATNVNYEIGFEAATAATVESIVVDFCSASPIIGDSCTIPTGFSVGTPTVTIDAGLTGTWTAASLNSGRTLTLTKSTGDALSVGTAVQFTLSTATNPSTTNQTYYARILTYANDSGTDSAATYTDTAPGNAIDAGGVALSTANQINITAKVQERLTFCVYTGANCAAGGSNVVLGDSNGVLDPTNTYVDDTTKYDVSTNASQGVAIRVKGKTLESGSFSIASIGATPATSSAGSEQFGFCTVATTGSGLTATDMYDGSSGVGTECSTTADGINGHGTANFAFDTTNTDTTYGQIFANKLAGDSSSGKIAFIGNIGNTTEAGIYTTALTFVATGTY